MSNFLQRIASTVAGNAAPRLHPMLGSVFAPAAPLAHFEAPVTAAFPISSETFAFRPQEHEQAGASPHSQQAPLLDPSVLHAPAAFSRPDHVPNPTGTVAPLLPQHDAAAALESALLSLSSMREPQATHRAAGAKACPTTESPAPAPVSHRLQPLLSAAILSPSRIMPARTAPDDPQRQARREPDEIHIHIGRIDVAAVTPPAARPAPAPARKSLSLEEYLRRGHGRPG